MWLRAPLDLAALIRERRRELKLSQAELARLVGTSRQWVVGVEKGRPKAEVGLVLRALNALGLRLDVSVVEPREVLPDVDAIVDAGRKGRE
jgi:HTH-type transcriptional regulator / antitoxin HipB